MAEEERPTAISQLIHKMAPLDTVETDAYADILNKKLGPGGFDYMMKVDLQDE